MDIELRIEKEAEMGGRKLESMVIFAPNQNYIPYQFMQNLHQFQVTFESYLENNKFKKSPRELYEPSNYILSLGGKRIRPAILLAGHYLFDDEVQNSLPAAFAVELFHNFSLVHDDIMDAAPLRRGQPTVHNKFGLNSGILSGDAMLVLAYESLLQTESSQIVHLIKLFNQMALQVCEGQQLDMNFETRQNVSIEEYLRMIELKTAVLVAVALEIGALIGGAKKEDAKLLYEFGRNLGIAFQLQDDILDAFGDPKKFGKKTGGDIAQNKKTYLYLKVLEIAPTAMAEKLKALYTSQSMDEADKIRAVLEIFEQLNIKKLTEEKKEEFWKYSIQALESVNALPGRKSMLEKFASALMNRDF
ncbi:MAG: polyprenyl synthetase family protein [Bacteroidales bacterium]|nr:polyprenyl synthetase family protein [Bacteroidales bacterium]